MNAYTAFPTAEQRASLAKIARRFVIEGTWTGYRSSQERVVYRSVHTRTERKLLEWARKTYGIRYTDGTMLLIRVRNAEHLERVKELKGGYGKLIQECVHYGVSSVQELVDIEQASKSALPQQEPKAHDNVLQLKKAQP